METAAISERLGESGRRLTPAQPCALAADQSRTHDPLAMQKVVGSNPIIRFARNQLQRVRFSRLAGRS
jgi:hypothetical protein